MFVVAPVNVPAGTLVTANLHTSAGTLLGSVTGEPVFGLPFHSAASLFTLGSVLDFGPLQAPFSGYFDLTTDTALTFDTTYATNVNLGHATGSQSTVFNAATAQVTSVAFVAPEPSYAGLLGILLSGAVIRRRFARSRAA